MPLPQGMSIVRRRRKHGWRVVGKLQQRRGRGLSTAMQRWRKLQTSSEMLRRYIHAARPRIQLLLLLYSEGFRHSAPPHIAGLLSSTDKASVCSWCARSLTAPVQTQLQQRIRVKTVSLAADSATLTAQLEAARRAHGDAAEAQSQADAELQVLSRYGRCLAPAVIKAIRDCLSTGL